MSDLAQFVPDPQQMFVHVHLGVLGTTNIKLNELLKPGSSKELKLSANLLDNNDRQLDATIYINITYKPPPGAKHAEVGGGGTVVTVDEVRNMDIAALFKRKRKPLEEEPLVPVRDNERSNADRNGAKNGSKKQPPEAADPPGGRPVTPGSVKDGVAHNEGYQPEAEKEEEEEDEDEDVDIQDGDSEAVKKMKKRKRKKKRATARKIRGVLSDKAQDFQVRIKIVEGRQLPGANISPICRVTCYNQTKQTRIHKSTNSPFFNEVFFFNFFASPADLFDEMVTFGGDIGMIHDEPQHSFINKWLLLSDPEDSMSGAKGYLKICATVLGPGDEAPSFKAQTQDEQEDIENNLLRPAGVMLRPATFKLRLYRAEDIPRMDSDFIQGVKHMFGSREKKELVDPYFIFSFAGNEVRSKTIYHSENPEWNQELRLSLRFPSMCERIKFQIYDWDKISEDDCVCSGSLDTKHISRSGETGVMRGVGKNEPSLSFISRSAMIQRSVVRNYTSKDPVLMDRIGGDDPAAVASLSVSDISYPGTDAVLEDAEEDSRSVCVSTDMQMFTSSGNLTPDVPDHPPRGFLPTFGPCFVNFYGSPREYSDLPDEFEDLNLGKGEGVAYRGRALVELQTVLGDTPETPVEDINKDDLLRVQKFMRRRKYKLHAAFLNATMVTAVDAPVEFEVSIGNYGNKLDESVPPCSSTTQPTNAVFDGAYYYFLPWADTKPCVVVDSHWEDISFRLENLNHLLHIIERLKNNIEKVSVGLKANLGKPELAQLMIALLDQLVDDCRKPLAPVIDGQHIQNELDRHLRYYREAELRHMKQSAKKLRESATDIKEALDEVEGYLAQLNNLATEPQNSMPDVIIWMICGSKRVAYYRCPAHLILWSANPDYRGKYCGILETYSLKFPGNKAEKENRWEIPGLLRMKLWLGLEKHESEWRKMQTEGEMAVFAETYENQVAILGSWTNKGPTMSRPKFSDATGKIEFNKEDFNPPPGWRWDGDWYISPELSMLFDKDAGHTQFMEDVYENESRYPGASWGPSSTPWTDVVGDSTTPRDEVELPEGWEWEEDWQIDLNRAVDEYGWEYTVEATMGGYGPVEKTYHMCRRRRWLRSRQLIKDIVRQKAEEKQLQEITDGWEYAPLFNMKFHHKERRTDLVRRRRWHRKMVADSPSAPCFFQVQTKAAGDERYRAALTAPRMFLICKKPCKYQLRAYIYQARDLLAGDSNGLSDPFARVVFLNQSDATERLDKTLCPTWDQTLIFEQISIHGNPDDIAIKPPEIIVEIFDYDTFGGAEFLGRTKAHPMVKLDAQDSRLPMLQWYSVQKGEEYGGELLAAFELLLHGHKRWMWNVALRDDSAPADSAAAVDSAAAAADSAAADWVAADLPKRLVDRYEDFTLTKVTPPMFSPLMYFIIVSFANGVPFDKCSFELDPTSTHSTIEKMMDAKELPFLPPKRGKIFIVPNGIRPVMQRTAIEVMCWGVRNMAKFQLGSVTSPSVEFEVGGLVVRSKVIRNTKKNPNFEDPVLFFDIMLPKEELYTPPLNICVRDNRQFGRKPMVGVHIVKSLEAFRCEPAVYDEDPLQLAGNVSNGKDGTGVSQTTQSDQVIIDISSDEKTPIKTLSHELKKITKGKSCDRDCQLKKVSKDAKNTSRSAFAKSLKMPNVAGIISPLFSDDAVMEAVEVDEDIDWWSKYYASTGELDKCKQYLEQGYDKLQVFDCDLEKVGHYNGFDDFSRTFTLTRGKNVMDEESEAVGEFKGLFRVYPLPGDPNVPMPPRKLKNLPPSTPEECIIRIYIIKALDLQPNDPSGLADPYVDIKLGKNKVNNRDSYLPNTLNPVFGRMFEIKATIPIVKDLYIRIKDYDLFGTDDVIGETVIDLENRFLTKFRAICGLPKTYCVSGPTIWRDSMKPKDLLEDFCLKLNIQPAPVYSGSSVKIGNRVFNLVDFETNKPIHHHLGGPEQRLALHVLNTLPASLGIPFVPEHLETRPLYNPLQPGIEQGKLQMWIDIFPSHIGPPGPPVDITARVPKRYELRVIIWNTKDVILDEESITGEKMSDIYVKGWLSGLEDDKQETDVHYRSLDGEGNFNWRFVFPFDYIPAEECIAIRKKEHFWSLDQTERKLPPNLQIQVWDNDKFSADDFLGTLELNLNNMPTPTKKSSKCTLDRLPNIEKGNVKPVRMISLFEQKRVKGYWPCYNDESGAKELTGKVEMELELVPETESQERPAGHGRDEPNQHPKLEAPIRPDTSFLWFTSPWKTMKHIVWHNYKWYFITGIIILFIIIFIILFIYSMPSAVTNKLFS
ncbi:hypothetical protein LSH36_700g01069 [Paralvinella palmiformis]|uniref:C2 domain-containing protein n=1 Tax=Paralvinella palmiformis TaxID=53620 RepID=A0AAD9J350_9ANNE|nr:hypothetical protein LSH36_700g01069 [Paralvinella palmiformis]